MRPPLLSAISILLLANVALAQTSGSYCYDANAAGNAEYPEMDSKCTVVTEGTTETRISAKFLGPQVAAKVPDPFCASLATDVVCRRICGDLPRGKKPGGTLSLSFSPPSFARFGEREDFDRGDHFRVCYRVKNWANAGFNKGQERTFTFSVGYQLEPPTQPGPASGPPPAPHLESGSPGPGAGERSHTVINGDCLALIAGKYFGKQDWMRLFEANRAKIKDPNLIFPGQVLRVP